MYCLNLPVQGPLSPEDFCEYRAIPGLPPCSRLALGTAGLGGVWGAVDEDESVDVLLDGFAAGHLLVDSSPNYAAGRSEEVLGRALRRWEGPPPTVLTKLEGYPRFAPPAFAPTWRDSLDQQFAASLDRFGRRPDGLAMHDPESAPPPFQHECHAYLRERQRAGDISVMGLGGGGPALQPRWLDTGDYRYAITFKRLGAVSLQALADTVPACQRNHAAVVVGSPLVMGLLGGRHEEFLHQPPSHLAPVFLERARAVKRLADEAKLPLSQLALRFVLSAPCVDFVLAGPWRRSDWEDSQEAFAAGPLKEDLYRAVWAEAVRGEEPVTGG